MVRDMARQLARGMGPSTRTAAARSPPAAHPYSIRFRDALGKRREESGHGTQGDAIERLTQLYAEKKTTAPSVAAARRELGQLTVEEYAKQWRPRQQRMTDYSTGWHVDSSVNVHIVPRMGARKLNSVTPMVVERFLDEVEGDGVGRSNQVNMFRSSRPFFATRTPTVVMADDPVNGAQAPDYVRGTVAIPSLGYVTKALTVADEDLALQIVMMAGCRLRCGEARAVNVDNVVGAGRVPGARADPLQHAEAGEAEAPQGGGVPRDAPAAIGAGGGRALRGHARRHEGRLPAAWPGWLLHRRHGATASEKLFADLPPKEGVGM
jgi:hypothetical protein